MIGSAIISDCGVYRYRLERDLGDTGGFGHVVAGIMVNPSTATADVSDQTITKWVGFAQRSAYDRIIIGNKFAFRSTDVNGLRGAADPVGPENDKHLEQIMRDADIHVVAWGSLAKLPKSLRERWREVAFIARRVGCPLYCWGKARDGHPRHPLMLSYNTKLETWSI